MVLRYLYMCSMVFARIGIYVFDSSEPVIVIVNSPLGRDVGWVELRIQFLFTQPSPLLAPLLCQKIQTSEARFRLTREVVAAAVGSGSEEAKRGYKIL